MKPTLLLVLGDSRLLFLALFAPAFAWLLSTALGRLAGRASAATKHLLWLLAFAVMAAGLPVAFAPFNVPVPILPAVPKVPATPVPVPTFPWQEEPDRPEGLFVGNVLPVRIPVPPPLPKVIAPQPATPAPQPPKLPWPAIALLAWATGIALLFLKSLVGLARLRRLRRHSRPVEDPALLAQWKELCPTLLPRRSVALLTSAPVAIPLVTGFWRPCVLLPPASLAWPTPAQRAALVHELAHLRRHDLFVAAFARFVAALYWFHPCAWLALRSLQSHAEMAADDCVVILDAEPTSYAETLVQLARDLRRGAATPFPAIGMLRRGGLEARVARILDPACRRFSPRPTFRWATLTAATLLGAALALLRPAAAAPSPLRSAPPAATAGDARAPFAPDTFRLENADRLVYAPRVAPLASNAATSPFLLESKPKYVVRVVYDYSSFVQRIDPFKSENSSYNFNGDFPGPGYRAQKANSPGQSEVPPVWKLKGTIN
jgi:beta-lactamase regulating signal transducer with metallopeptidase domain